MNLNSGINAMIIFLYNLKFILDKKFSKFVHWFFALICDSIIPMLTDFYKKYFLFCLVLFLIGIYPVMHMALRSQVCIFLNFLVFGALTFVSSVIILGSISKNNSNLSSLVMASMALKLVFALVYFLLTYILLEFNDRVLIFVGSFFLAYLLFMVFEVAYIAWYIKKNKS